MNLFRKKSIESIVKNAADNPHGALKRNLNVTDLTAFGIAAIIGAGIFSTIGSACYSGGPAVVFLFLFTAIASTFSAFCYAEFATRLPIAGSAYTYAYASFGELLAWIIGWALLMEYSIGNIAVAISWSGYFTGLLHNVGVHFPAWLSTDYFTAQSALTAEAQQAWATAPNIGFRLIFDLPALVINALITWLVYVGIKESKRFSNAMVLVKLGIILLVISVGFFYIDTANYTPFAPNGAQGVMGGVAAVFFAYIGFDAISTTAEECHNPQRDLPRGMIYSLVICTVLYILIALVLTGMVRYSDLKVDDPLAFVFSKVGVNWISGVISVSALVAMTSVLLVFQMGQPRIWLSMSRDGLLPPSFSKIHPRYHTPSFATIATGVVVGVPILFLNYDFVIAFTSIGTLFAFVLVCGGVLLLPKRAHQAGKFNMPKISGKYIVPAGFVLALVLLQVYLPTFLVGLVDIDAANAATQVPLLVFMLICVVLSVFSFIKDWALIPVLGLMSCFYLLTGMTPSNWLWFLVWFGIGLIIYFAYGYRKSKLAQGNE
jgi:amino acid transporter